MPSNMINPYTGWHGKLLALSGAPSRSRLQCNHPIAWAIQSCRLFGVGSVNGRKRFSTEIMVNSSGRGMILPLGFWSSPSHPHVYVYRTLVETDDLTKENQVTYCWEASFQGSLECCILEQRHYFCSGLSFLLFLGGGKYNLIITFTSVDLCFIRYTK